MQETGNKRYFEHSKVIIRVAGDGIILSASNVSEENRLEFEPYKLKNGISIAANLREILAKSQLTNYSIAQALVFVDTPIILAPIDEFIENEAEEIYNYTAQLPHHSTIAQTIMPNLNCVATFSVNKDLMNVVSDNFDKTRVQHILVPVWKHFQNKSYNNVCRKMFCYFDSEKVNIVAYKHNRFKFNNTFNITSETDAAYYILNVWQQLAMTQEKDELYITGNIRNIDKLQMLLKKYINKTYIINPITDVANPMVTSVLQMPYDSMLYYTKGE